MVTELISHHVKNACVQIVDGRNVRGPIRRQYRVEEVYHRRRRNDKDEDFTWLQRTVVDLETMARDAFERVDDVHDNIVNEEGQAAVDFDNVDNDEYWNHENFDFLVRESIQPVFERSTQIGCSVGSCSSHCIVCTPSRTHSWMPC